MWPIDNIVDIMPLLEFPTEDIFYTLQIIRRKKDGNDLSASQVVILSKSIRGKGGLFKIYSDMKAIANALNARIYINLNAKSAKKTTTAILRQACQDVDDNQFTPHRLFDKAAGGLKSCLETRWIIDMDIDPVTNTIFREDEILSKIPRDVILATIPTVNGYHLITKGFDPRPLRVLTLNVDIHKNNPTLLYFKRQE